MLVRWSTSAAPWPASRPSGNSRRRSRTRCCVVRDGGASDAHRRADPADALERPHARELAGRRRPAPDEVERRCDAAQPAPLERVGHLARARGRGQDTCVDAGEADAEHGRGERHEQPGARERDDRGPAHDCVRDARPAAARGRSLPAARRQRVDALAEHSEERGERHERDRRGADGDERASHGHRREEAQREDAQRPHRRGDRQRAEHDRPARRRERGAQRVGPRPATRELLPVAGDEQEAVVDREPEPETRDQVEREHRHVHQLGDRAQAEQGGPDRDHPDERRQQRGNDAAEDEQRQEEHDRERDELGALEVAPDGRVDLLVRDGPAAEHDARLVGEGVAKPGRRLLRPDVEPVAEEPEDEATAEAGARDLRIGGDSRAHRGDVSAPNERDDAGVGLDPGRVLQDVERAHALGGRVLEEARPALQVRHDRRADDERGDREGRGRHQDRAPAAQDQPCHGGDQ